MNKTRLLLFSLLGLLALRSPLAAQSTAFTYQGQLTDGGAPANGCYNLSFGLYPTNISGASAGNILTNDSVTVSNGLFTMVLDFGPVFDGTPYWLEIGIQACGSTNGFIVLSPRQPLNSSPYALHAANAGTITGVLATTNLPSTVALLDSSPNFSGTISADGFVGSASGMTNLNAAQLTTGTMPEARLSTNVALLNGNNNWTGTNNFANGLSTGSNFVSTFNGSNSGWQLMQRAVVNFLPVPALRPTKANSRLAFDGMPNGNPGDSSSGVSWLDWCLEDCQNVDGIIHAIHLATHPNFMEVSSVNYNGGTALPLLFGYGKPGAGTIFYYFGISNNTFMIFTNTVIMNHQNGGTTISVVNTNAGSSALVQSSLQVSATTNVGFKTLVLGYGFLANGALMPGAGVLDAAPDLTNGLNLVVEAPAPLRFYMGGYANSNLSLVLDQNGSLSLSNRASFNRGVASYATNVVSSASSAGYTNNTLGINMVANIAGTSGTYVFYNRSGAGGATVCGLPLFTNTVTPAGAAIPVPVNCGISVLNGSDVTIQAYAQ